MPAIYHEGSWLGNATDPEVLVKDTVGWTGKNRAYSQTNNAVIAHIENGITYDVSWTGSATVTLKKNSASGATITSGSTSPLSFTADADYELYFGSSATVTNIMVKDSRITDPTYEPYHESVEEEIEQIYADNGVLGAKNLIPYPYYSSNPVTSHGITFTLDQNGIIYANGTNDGTEPSDFYMVRDSLDKSIISGGILTGCPSGGSDNTYRLLYRVGDSTSHVYKRVYRDYGDGVIIPSLANNEDARIYIQIRENATVSNLQFKPMLRLASDPDDTYQPYAMTNRELTNGKADKTDLTSIIATGSTNATGATITSGTYFYLNGTLVRAKANIANGATYTLNTNYEEMTAGVLNNPAKSWVVVFYYGTQIGVPNYTRNNNILLKVGHLVFMSCNFNITSRGNGTSPRISTKSYKLPYKPNATAVGTFANSIKTLNMVAEKDNDEYFILKNLDGTDATVTDMAVGDVTLTIVYTTDE